MAQSGMYKRRSGQDMTDVNIQRFDHPEASGGCFFVDEKTLPYQKNKYIQYENRAVDC